MIHCGSYSQLCIAGAAELHLCKQLIKQRFLLTVNVKTLIGFFHQRVTRARAPVVVAVVVVVVVLAHKLENTLGWT